MRTCLSAAAELQRPEQLPEGWADGAALLHLEGYCLYRPHLAEAAILTARHKGAAVSAAAFCSHAHCDFEDLVDLSLIKCDKGSAAPGWDVCKACRVNEASHLHY